MEKLQWLSELDTGIEVIDEQHKRIVYYINQLQDAHEKHSRSKVGDVINEVVDYTISHFAFEEALMEQAGYSFCAPHKKVHELFISRVDRFAKRHEEGQDVAEELLITLRKWLINHIQSEDGDYVQTVQAYQRKMRHEHEGWLSRSLHRFFG
ncbi:bacteriohemerythrin [Aestuariirhabdus sp. Z084]|uniref:bacteriohemerythrin n=1 Tax=Aestuariirhabdus haliotis TaxID=2918751 RepID=UPI00201B3C14|nr:bacteriohemerythrin [Aestuariirhabdus haliotis]MCL6416574.1 bacteriohemerythrin [Aestuariirhabdus haliotis]MCL6420559.1 bacteriohemerythrin [Aestuariirhabdus haliotis]